MKELLALLPESRRKFIEFLCENEEPLSLSMLSHKLLMSHRTVRGLAEEFESLGLVKIYESGRAKVITPTEKLKTLCEQI